MVLKFSSLEYIFSKILCDSNYQIYMKIGTGWVGKLWYLMISKCLSLMRYRNDILINDKIKVWNVNKVKLLIGGLMSIVYV